MTELQLLGAWAAVPAGMHLQLQEAYQRGAVHLVLLAASQASILAAAAAVVAAGCSHLDVASAASVVAVAVAASVALHARFHTQAGQPAWVACRTCQRLEHVPASISISWSAKDGIHQKHTV